MYSYTPNWIPERYTSTDSDANDAWTVDYIENLIRVSTGAAMLGEVDKWGFFGDPERPSMKQFPSYIAVVKMNPRRWGLLVVLPLAILVCGAVLMRWNVKMHGSMAIPIMRKATLGEVKSIQTPDVLSPAAGGHYDAAEPSRLEKLDVWFREGETGVWGLYNPKRQSVLLKGEF